MARKNSKKSGGGGRRERGLQAVRESEVSDDEVDAFHEQRDKIVLGDASARQQDDPFDALDDRQGVLGIRPSDSESDEEEYEDEEEDEEAEDVAVLPTKKASKGKKQAVPAADSSDDDEDEAGSEEEVVTGGWGSNKRAYYNTNDLENLDSDSEMDEDERRAMELREVKKIQQASRQGMVDDDFGLGDSMQQADEQQGQAARQQRRKELVLDGSLPLSGGRDDHAANAKGDLPVLNPAELIAKVQRETPETMALVGEFADMVDEMNEITNRMKVLQESDPNHPSLGLIHLHHQTLLTYVTTLTFYFYVRASPTATLPGTSGRRIPTSAIIERLAKLKTGLSALEDFGLGKEEEEPEEDEEDDDDEMSAEDRVSFLFKPRSMFQGDGSSDEEDSQSLGSLEDDELTYLESEEKENRAVPAPAKRSKSRNATETMSLEAVMNDDEGPSVTKKASGKDGTLAGKKGKGKAATKDRTAPSDYAPLAALADMANDDDDDEVDDTMAPPSKRRKPAGSSLSRSGFDDIYSEPTSLSAVDLADKEATKRSLKFHTGNLDARQGVVASARRLQGDVDIPYRDKERSRTAVAATNANKTAKANQNAAARRQLDQDDFGESDAQDWRDVMNDVDGRGPGAGTSKTGGHGPEDDYYDLITSARKSAKRAQKEEYDEERLASRVAPAEGGAMEAGEHRAIDRTIEKNRGLTPRRPKASRNPRVKKRLRYEQAQKKLSSRGPVYKGGQAALQGGYSGESSGISSHVVKSRQFA